MRVLLVSLNRETEPFTAAPLGPALVAASLRADGHDVELVDLLLADEPAKAAVEAVRRFGPGLVGLSLRNVESSTEFLMPSYREVVNTIREATSAPLVMGGAGFSVMPQQALGYLGVEYGIKGEGERAARNFVRALERGDDPAGIPGVCVLRRGAFSMTPAEAVDGLDILPSAEWGDMSLDGYDMVGLQSKRGCSFSCAYCTYPQLEGRRMRLRSPASVAREAQALVTEHGRPSFYFVDNVFNNPRRHAMEVCAALASLEPRPHWGCLASPVGLDSELLDAMTAAGCESVEIGADSLSDRALMGLGKPFSAADAAASVRACKAAGMGHMLFLILGGPGEDEDTLRETFDVLDAIAPDKVFAVAGIRVYPETPIHRIAVEEGQVGPKDPLLEPRFYVSDRLGDRLYDMAGEFFGSRPGWIYYRATAIQDSRPAPVPLAVADMDDGARTCLVLMLNEVPRLMRPIAKRAVTRKAGMLAHERGLSGVTSAEVVDAFLAETPGPFRSAMEDSLRKHGFMV